MNKSRLPLSSCCHKGPAALLGLFLTAGCTDPNLPTEPAVDLCRSEITPITTIQGDAYQSPLLGSEVTVRAVVTHIDDGGFYIEEPGTPTGLSASRALFVTNGEHSVATRVGRQLALTGSVAELGETRDTLTSLIDITGHQVCVENATVPRTSAELPLDSLTRETLEGMQVAFEQKLTVSDVYRLSEGELTLSSNGVLRIPTEISMPGPEANRQEDENRAHSIVATLPESAGPLQVGSTMPRATGLMGHDGRRQQLLLGAPAEISAPQGDLLAPAAEGTIRIVNSNLLNFFNGDGTGGGFPTERGAESPEELEAQSARIQAAMSRIQPDLLAVQELENDGFGANSAAASLLALLNRTGHEDWAFASPGTGPIGGDVITVGLFYRRQVLETEGEAQVLEGPEFEELSRQPLAQLFRDRRSGKTFLVAVNHLKSKGRCPEQGENSDRRDGQNCWNAARVSAVTAQLPWLQNLASGMNTEKLLILGDMNAWRKEDPIRKFGDYGLLDLVEQLSGLPQHSFLFWGQTGTLDYAFASPSLARHAKKAVIWHINADFPRNMEQSQPWLRASDHDPVIVDFDFSHSATSD